MGTVAALASLIVLVLIAIVLWLSLIDGEPGDPDLAYTAANYIETFGDRFVWRVLANTFVFSGLTLAVAMAIGAPLAWIIERTDFPAKTLVFATMTIGLLVSGLRHRDRLGVLASSAHWHGQHGADDAIPAVRACRSASRISGAWAGSRALGLRRWRSS